MPPVSLGCSSCYNERGCGVTSGLAFVGGTGPWMWGWRLEVPLSSFASSWSQEKITRCHAWAQQSSHAGVCCNCEEREACWKLSLHYQADFGGNPGWTALARLKNGRDKLKFKLFCLQGCKLCSVLRQAVSELHPYFSCGTPWLTSPSVGCLNHHMGCWEEVEKSLAGWGNCSVTGGDNFFWVCWHQLSLSKPWRHFLYR